MNQCDRGGGAIGIALLEIPGLPHPVRHMSKTQNRLAPRLGESVEGGCLHLYRKNTFRSRRFDGFGGLSIGCIGGPGRSAFDRYIRLHQGRRHGRNQCGIGFCIISVGSAGNDS